MEIQQSLEAILDHGHTRDVLAEHFYSVFLEQYPEVQRYFHGIDLHHQAVLLSMSLSVVKDYYVRGYPTTRMYLKYLGAKHHHRGVPFDAYPKFRDVLLKALERLHGDDWDRELAGQWRAALDHASEAMFEGYSESATL